MMETITYSLRGNNATSDQYYTHINAFSRIIHEKNSRQNALYINQYSRYFAEKKTEECMPKEIIYFEFLMMGVLWNTYIHKAIELNSLSGHVLKKMVFLREQNRFKGVIDFFRGIFGTAFLLKKRQQKEIAFSMEHFRQLIHWLKASGEFTYEAERIETWEEFMTCLPKRKAEKLLMRASTIGHWFKDESNHVIGKYTSHVNAFIQKNDEKMKWQEHRLFCTRSRVEYHLNMVGAEIMNRAFRENFLKTKEKRVLLPICMRAQSEACKAHKSQEGYRCTGCTEECSVRHITLMGRQHGFKVFIIPHASTAFSKLTGNDGQIGIVGIACVLNLVSGGYKAKALGFEPQCVLLDYCGCKKHWHEHGLTTSINLEGLKRILGVISDHQSNDKV